METSRKKIIIIAVISVIVVALIISGIIYYVKNKKPSEQPLSAEEQEISKRVQDLEASREQFMQQLGIAEPTEKEITERINKIEQTSQVNANTKTPVRSTTISEEEIKQRIESLNKLR